MTTAKKHSPYNKVYFIQTDEAQLELLKDKLKNNQLIKGITNYTIKDNDITFINIAVDFHLTYNTFQSFAENIIKIIGFDTKIFYKSKCRSITYTFAPQSILFESKKNTKINFITDDE